MMRFRLVSILATLPLVGAVAFAQETPVTPPPAEEVAPPPAPPTVEVQPAPPPPVVVEPVYVAPPPAPPPVVVYEPRHHHHNRIFAPGLMSLTTGAGATNYFGTGVTGLADVGAAWDARVTFGTESVLALEAAYVGSVNNVDMGGGHGQLFGNGVDGDLRLQLPFRVQPYVFGGVGWNHAAIKNLTGVSSSNVLTASTDMSDDQFNVPAGGGLTGYIGRHTTLDLRGTYRFTPDNSLPIQTDKGQMHQWMAQAHVGYVF